MRTAYIFALLALTLLFVPRSASSSTPIGYSPNPVNGTLTTNSGLSPDRGGYYTFYADLYTFSGVAGQTITITMTSSAFSPYLYLHDPSGAVVASSYNSSGYTAMISNYSLTSSGTYTIDATTSNYNTTGAYSLNLNLYTASGTPAAPTNLTATAGDGQVSLAWSASSGANSYNVKRATTSGGPYNSISTGSAATNYTNTGLPDGTTYYYVVTGVNGYGEGAISSQVSAKPLPPPPAAPTGLIGTPGNNSVALQWQSAGTGASYAIYRNGSSNPIGTAPAAYPTGTYQDNTAVGGTTYTYYVVAVDRYGQNSAPSNSVTVTPTQPINNASCTVSNGLPATVTAGQTYPVTVAAQNTGNTTWTSGNLPYRLTSINPNDNTTWTASNRVELPYGTPVSPGQTATFQFSCTAPSTPGTYHWQWQMGQDGAGGAGRFGSPMTDAVINVIAPVDGATCSAPSGMPTTLRAGQTYPVSVTVQNTGNTKWPANSVYQLLSQNPNNNNNWGVRTVNIPADVAPGASVTFTFNVTAPSLPGIYNFQWQMIHQGIGTFGSPTPNVVCANPADDAAFVSQTAPPTTIQVGQSYPVSVTMKNMGTNAWPANSAYQLLSQNPNNNNWWSVQTVNVPASVAPGASVTFTFTAVAPSVPGAYNFQWQMIHQGIGTFGDMTPNVPCANPADAAAFVSQTPPPSTIRAGQPYQVSVTMRNNGTNTWATDNSFALSSTNSWWSPQLVNPPVPIPPGAQVTFNFTVTAPVQPGAYTWQWQMVHQGVSVFGDITPGVPCANAADDALFVSQITPPPTVQAGQSYPVSVTMKNAGTNTWPTDGSYALNSQNPTNNAWWHVQLVNPPAAIPPGQVTFNFNAVAPVVPGSYHFQWRMLHQGSALFGDLTPDVPINVAPFTFTGDTTALSLSIMDGAPDGGPAETLFTLTPLGGFTGNVALTLSYLDTSGNLVSGAPGGMDYWFDPAPDDTPTTGQVAIPDANPQDCLLSICPCAGNPVAGTYTLVITATSGTTTLTQNVTLTITP